MGINVTIDAVEYSGIERIAVGGKSLMLSASASAGGSGADVDTGSFVGDNGYLLTLPTTKKRSHLMIYTHAAPEDIWAAAGFETGYPLKMLFLMDNVETNDDYTEKAAVRGQYRCFLSNSASTPTVLNINTPFDGVTFGNDSISLTKFITVNTSVFAKGITFNWIAW